MKAAADFGWQDVDTLDVDLTAGHRGEPIGERIILTGRLLDAAGGPVAGAVGLQLLLGHPECVVAAALICTAARIGDPDDWQSGRRSFARREPVGSWR